jgi:hypothetical protein
MAMVMAVLGFVLLAAGVVPLEAQQGVAPSLRPYWHVFVAYAIAWGLVMGWAISIARRLAAVERRLARREGGGGE